MKGSKAKKKQFSSFDMTSAYKLLSITHIMPWQLKADPYPSSEFFGIRLQRLRQVFDLRRNEEAKKMLIDAFCEEAMLDFRQLRIWKGAYIEGETTCGSADYLVAQNRDYLEDPFVCIVEALDGYFNFLEIPNGFYMSVPFNLKDPILPNAFLALGVGQSPSDRDQANNLSLFIEGHRNSGSVLLTRS